MGYIHIYIYIYIYYLYIYIDEIAPWNIYIYIYIYYLYIYIDEIAPEFEKLGQQKLSLGRNYFNLRRKMKPESSHK